MSARWLLRRTEPLRHKLGGIVEQFLRRIHVIPPVLQHAQLFIAKPCHSSWHIPETLNLDPDPVYQMAVSRDFQLGYESFLLELKDLYESNDGAFVVRVNDGEYYFLQGVEAGNTIPGRRHFNKRHPQSTRKAFRSSLHSARLIGIGMNWTWRDELIRAESISRRVFPAEYISACLASGWLLSSFPSMGVIGADEKIDLIARLMKCKPYQEYIGREQFTELIGIPQKFAGDRTDEITQVLIQEISQSDTRLFIVGMGIAKLGILPRLADETKRIFVDVGTGIDAIAGIVDPYRPFMGGWTNYQLLDENAYSRIDFCQVAAFGNRFLLSDDS